MIYRDLRNNEKGELHSVFTAYITESPIISLAPHSGTLIPNDLEGRLITDQFLTDADLATRQIYNLGHTLISTSLSRNVVDLNRARNDESSTGVIRRVAFDDSEILSEPYSEAMREALLTNFYDPFFAYINKAIEMNKGKKMLILNGHSMDSVIPKTRERDESERNYLFGLMTTNRTLAEPKLIQTFIEYIADKAREFIEVPEGMDVIREDEPYEEVVGGISERYGRPQNGINSFLLEINKNLIHNDETFEFYHDNVKKLNQLLRNAIEEVSKVLN